MKAVTISDSSQLIFVASWPRRIAAYVIDSGLTWLCLAPIWIQLAGTYFTQGASVLDFRWALSGVLFALFYQWMFVYFLGGTVGKLLLGLRVRSIHRNQPLGLMQSFLRVMTNSLSIFFGDSLRALAFLRLDRRHVGDWVAETWVVQETPLAQFPSRHWVLGGLMFVLIFTSSLKNCYHVLQNVEVVGGQIVFDADR